MTTKSFTRLELQTPAYFAELSADLRYGTVLSHDELYSVSGPLAWLQLELAMRSPDPMLEALELLADYSKQLAPLGWEGLLPPEGDVLGVKWEAPEPANEDLVAILDAWQVKWVVELVPSDGTTEGVFLEVPCFGVFARNWELQP